MSPSCPIPHALLGVDNAKQPLEPMPSTTCFPDGISDPLHPAVPLHPPHNCFLCPYAMLAPVSDAGRGLKAAVHGVPTTHGQ